MAGNSTLDGHFGPQLQDHFDFTLLFEQTILTILPSCLLIAVSPIYIFQRIRKPACTRSGLLLWAKLAAAISLFTLEAAGTAIWSSSTSFRSRFSLAAASLSCINAVCIAAMLYAEHRHSLRPSTLISIYLSITLLFDIAKSRSCFSRPGLHSLGALSAVIAVLKLTILALEEMSKKSLVVKKEVRSSLGKEAAGGFWNRSLFFWLNSTLLFGFRNILNVEDLQEMGPTFDSTRLFTRFKPIWEHANKNASNALAKACFKTHARPIMSVVIPRLCFTGFKFAQPFLLQRVVTVIGQGEISKDVVGGLIGATILIYLGMAITKAYYTHLQFRMVTLLRGTLVSTIFDKTLRLKSSATKEAAAVTLMSTDIDGIEGGFSVFHEIWASVLELAIGIYLLATIVGRASFLVVLPGLVTTIAAAEIGRRMIAARLAWNQKVQTRVAATSSVLAQIKGVKMSGLAPIVSDQIQALRVTEIDYSKKLRILHVAISATATFSLSVTPVVVLAGGIFWTSISGHMTAPQAYTTLSIIALVSMPLVMILIAFPVFASSMACFARIEKFLLTEDRNDGRCLYDGNGPANSSDSGSDQKDSTDAELTTVPKTPSKTLPESSNHNAVEFLQASIAVADDADPILKDVSFSLPPGSLTMLVGPVGCGKSTLLKTVLGETKIAEGRVLIKDASIAYCDQKPWIQNTTIRDNIIGQCDFDQLWFDTVLHACALDEDMTQITNGIESLAGSGGVNVSGGQRHRIALARAVYSHRHVLVLDDVFSALDRETCQIVFSRLFSSDGIIRKSNTTVIMATHMIEHLSSADKVLTIDKEGHVRYQTNIQELTHGDVVKMYLEKPEVSEESTASPKHYTPSNTDTDEDLKERKKGDVELYYFYIKSIGIALFILWLFTVAVAAVADKAPQIFFRIWLEKDPLNNTYFIGFAVLGLGSLIFSSIMFSFYMLKLTPRSAENLHRVLLDSVMNATLGFLTATDSGSLLNRFSQDMTLISEDLPSNFMQVAYLAFSILTDIGIIASGAKYAAAVIPFFVVALFFLQKYYLRTSRQMRHLDLEAKSPLYTQFTETASGLQHIRAFGWQSGVGTKSMKLLDYSQKPYYYMFCIQRWLTLVLDICVLVIATVLITFALNFTNTTSESALGLALLNVITFGDTLSQLIKSWIELETSLGAIARLRTFFRKTPTEEDETDLDHGELPEHWPHRGMVEFTSVTARYRGAEDTTRPVLDDLSVIIKPGQKVGIVGRTGSGKSSFILTLLNLLDYSGSISIDGMDISRVSRQKLRSQITTIPQDSIDILGSIRLNLNPAAPLGSIGEGYSDEALIDVLGRVGLWQHISSRGGLDADLAEMGLSQGEKQLLCLARAILHNGSTGGKLVLVDEATSNMDHDTDARMQAVISEVFAGCTTIVIAHRLDTLKDVDVLLELDEGRLVRVTKR